VSFSFLAGLILIVTLWVKDNIPKPVDIDWLRQGGASSNPTCTAGRFNAGEKMVFWFALAPAPASSSPGYCCCFPFYFANMPEMQIAQVSMPSWPCYSSP